MVFEDDGSLYFSAGNYDDYVIYKYQSKEVSTPRKGSKSQRPREVSAGTSGRRLTYMEKEELGGIGEAIEDSEQEVARLEREISAPDFYQGRHERVTAVLHELEEAKGRIESLYARWEDLESRAHIK